MNVRRVVYMFIIAIVVFSFKAVFCAQEAHTLPDYAAWICRHNACEGSPILLTPKELLCADRYDVLAKYIYARLRELGAQTSWGYEMYDAHLHVWGNYTEGYPYKNGIKNFIDSFHDTLDSIKEHGFDHKKSCIPVRIDTKVALNGAHRIAASLLYHPNIPIQCATITAMRSVPPPIDADYFKKRTQFVKSGLGEKYLDAMALHYVMLKDNTFAVCLYHCARNKDEQVIDLIKRYAQIVYIKDLELTQHGPRNFISMVYDGESWTKVPEYLQHQIDCCFSKQCTHWSVRVFIIETRCSEKLVECKQKIRDLFAIGKRSVHINDTHDETLRIAQSVLNAQSIHFLNYADCRALHHFDHYFAQYKKWLSSADVDQDCFCVDSSAVLAAYGLRDCRDLDFLHYGYDKQLPHIAGVDSHNSWAHHYPIHKDEIIFHPDYHFYYKGVKFASLDMVRLMKLMRNEPKDQCDVRLIEKVIVQK